MSGRVALIDYGAGNLQSVHNGLIAAGATAVEVTGDADAISRADRIVLPGVGAFAACRNALGAVPDMIDGLNEAVLRKAKPFLGICVGMQLMVDAGEEHGTHDGLGWIAGKVRAIASDTPGLKIPHMGWNDVRLEGAPPLLMPGEAYFLHGYQVELSAPEHCYARTDHGGPITAAIGRDTMIGVQFHPEKSQKYGLNFLERFLEWRP